MRPSEVSRALAVLIPTRRPAYLWGPLGSAKSSVVRQTVTALGLQLVDVRATLLDPVDLRGLPRLDGAAAWCPPAFLPRSGEGVLFLDELARAPPLVQAGYLQLVLDRRVGDYTLPDGWAEARARARVVLEVLPRLPGSGAEDRPVTVDLAGRVAVRTRDPAIGWAEEVHLARPTAAGTPARVALNRDLLARLLGLGCHTVRLAGAGRSWPRGTADVPDHAAGRVRRRPADPGRGPAVDGRDGTFTDEEGRDEAERDGRATRPAERRPTPARSRCLSGRADMATTVPPAGAAGAVGFQPVYRRVRHLAGRAFRSVRCPHARDDLTAEAEALAWQMFAAGRVTGEVRRAVAMAGAGHTLCGGPAPV